MPDEVDGHKIAHLIKSARARLKRAATYDAEDRTEMTCEDAHQTAEYALKALIETLGDEYKSIHNVEHLLENLEDLGEEIPEEVIPAIELSDFSGGRRYDFITGLVGSPALESVSDAMKAARDTLSRTEAGRRAEHERSDHCDKDIDDGIPGGAGTDNPTPPHHRNDGAQHPGGVPDGRGLAPAQHLVLKPAREPG